MQVSDSCSNNALYLRKQITRRRFGIDPKTNVIMSLPGTFCNTFCNERTRMQVLEEIWAMINGNLNQFLDTGWYNEATLYYRDHVYWCEADTDFASNITRFWVTRWKACMSKDKKMYHTIVGNDQDPLDYSIVLDISGQDIGKLKKEFLQAPIFDGKSFWQVESDIAWLEEGARVSEYFLK